jgi:hypothetical protein
MFKVGNTLRGTKTGYKWTGEGNMVRVVGHIEDGKYMYVMARNGAVYSVHDPDDFVNAKPDGVSLDAHYKFEKSYRNRFGFTLGEVLDSRLHDVIKRHFVSFNKDMTPIFIGECISKNDTISSNGEIGKIHISLVKKDKDGMSGHRYVNISDMDFARAMLGEDNKLRIHYINNDGMQTFADVNDISEIKDMKKYLYKFQN